MAAKPVPEGYHTVTPYLVVDKAADAIEFYRQGDDVLTGGSLNTLWLDGHVSRIRETTGPGVLKRWYDPLGKNP